MIKDISVYFQDKIATERYVSNLHNAKKENYNVAVKLLKKEENASADIVLLQYQVVTTFNYEKCGFKTTVSDVIDVVYEKSLGKVVDIYASDNYYDGYVRENIKAHREYRNISEIKKFELTESIYVSASGTAELVS